MQHIKLLKGRRSKIDMHRHYIQVSSETANQKNPNKENPSDTTKLLPIEGVDTILEVLVEKHIKTD